MTARLTGLALLAVWLAACVALPPPPVSDNSAVRALVESARADTGAARYPNAVAVLERALRIEPRNPRLWLELARVRQGQGEYSQVEALAARSNSFAGGDARLRAENWRLIAESRRARGDEAGAEHARREADR